MCSLEKVSLVVRGMNILFCLPTRASKNNEIHISFPFSNNNNSLEQIYEHQDGI